MMHDGGATAFFCAALLLLCFFRQTTCVLDDCPRSDLPPSPLRARACTGTKSPAGSQTRRQSRRSEALPARPAGCRKLFRCWSRFLGPFCCRDATKSAQPAAAHEPKPPLLEEACRALIDESGSRKVGARQGLQGPPE
ncbi:hypothetical protein J3F83DRAFT_729976 [Trichoderma novae-zelandiae]